MDYREVLHFWFTELKPKDWFAKDELLDFQIRERFLRTHTMATKGELFNWRISSEGRLAEIIVLDQFSRNIFRGKPEAFKYDGMALILSQEMVKLKLDLDLPMSQRAFVYMPYMHSESPVIHEEALKLFQQKGLESNYDYELRHKFIIERFGRYPHRNEILHRETTAEETEFMKTMQGSF